MKLAALVYTIHFAHLILGLPVEGLEQAVIAAYASRS